MFNETLSCYGTMVYDEITILDVREAGWPSSTPTRRSQNYTFMKESNEEEKANPILKELFEFELR